MWGEEASICEGGVHNTLWLQGMERINRGGKMTMTKKGESKGGCLLVAQTPRALGLLRRKGERLELVHPACRDGERERHDGHSGLERDESAGDECEEPPEGAESNEAVEVPRRVVGDRATLPFKLVCPGALFLAPVFIRLCRYHWRG